MKNSEINPYVRFVQERLSGMLYPHPVLAYDFRMFYVKTGEITFRVSGEDYVLGEGALIVIPPAVGYQLTFSDVRTDYFVVNFDFSSDAEGGEPRPPVREELFDRSLIFSHICPAQFSRVWIARSAGRLEACFSELVCEWQRANFSSVCLCSALMKYVIGTLLSEREAPRGEYALIGRIKEYVDQSIDGALTNREIGRALGYHPHYLNAVFLEAEGTTLHKYVELRRLTRAKMLLVSTSMSVCEIAAACGFFESSYFTKFFIRHESVTPREYRRLSM